MRKQTKKITSAKTNKKNEKGSSKVNIQIKVTKSTSSDNQDVHISVDDSKPPSLHYRSDYHRTGHVDSDIPSLAMMWMENFPFEIKYLTPISQSRILLTPNSRGPTALFDVDE